MRVRFTSTPHHGLPIEGVTYQVGQVADLSPLWCAVLVEARQAEYVPHEVVRETVAVAEVEHRDTFRRVKRKP